MSIISFIRSLCSIGFNFWVFWWIYFFCTWLCHTTKLWDFGTLSTIYGSWKMTIAVCLFTLWQVLTSPAHFCKCSINVSQEKKMSQAMPSEYFTIHNYQFLSHQKHSVCSQNIQNQRKTAETEGQTWGCDMCVSLHCAWFSVSTLAHA